MKSKEEIKKRLAQLEDEILYTRAGGYMNFFKATSLDSEEAIHGAFIALKWALEEDEM